MKALTDKIKNEADITIKVFATSDIPLSGLAFQIAKTELKYHGFYSYTNANTDEKVLIIQC